MSEVLERDGLIDHDLIAAWHAENVAAADRLVAARLALAKAEEEHIAASHATGRAANAGDEQDVMAAQLRLEEKARFLKVAKDIFDSAAAAMTRSNGRRELVRGMAHRGMFEDAVRQRVEAARCADLAREALGKAEAGYRAATAQVRLAFQNGLSDCQGGALDGFDLVRTEAQERKHWKDRGIDPDRPKHPMVEPVAISDEQAHAEGLVRMSKGDDIIFVSPATLGNHVATGWRQI